MRHFLYLRGSPLTPTPQAQGVFETASAAVLVAPTGVALQQTASTRCAAIGAIVLPPITVTADEDLLAATRAQEESGSLV